MACVFMSWTQLLTYPDGTPFTNLAGFRIHLGTSTGVYPIVRDVGLVFSSIITGLAMSVQYFIAVKAYDNLGNESVFSTEVTATAHPYWTTSKQVMQ